MNKPNILNYWCVASLFFAIAIVVFLLVHPMNSISSSGSGLMASCFSAIVSP